MSLFRLMIGWEGGPPGKHGQAGLPSGLDQVNCDVDVPSRGFGVRARLVRAV